MEGIPDLFQTLETVRTYFNPKLAIEGILLTMYRREDQPLQAGRRRDS